MSGHTATWTLHRQPKDKIATHEFSIWRDDDLVILANTMPGEDDVLATIVHMLDSHAELVKALEEAQAFVQAEIDAAPEPLQRLGRFLADVLDEDRWKTAEGMLLGGITSHSNLVKLLEPFAAHADRYAIGAPDTADGFQVYVSLGECRAARAALATLTARKVG